VIPINFQQVNSARPPGTGLIRFSFRDYDPDIGRWTAKDPILFAGGDTDLYGYCLYDAVNFVDPTGEFAIFPVVATIAKGLGVLEGIDFVVKKYYEKQIYNELENTRQFLLKQINETDLNDFAREKILIDAYNKVVLQQAAIALVAGIDIMEEVTKRVIKTSRPCK